MTCMYVCILGGKISTRFFSVPGLPGRTHDSWALVTEATTQKAANLAGPPCRRHRTRDHDSYCDSCFAYAAHRYITSSWSACWCTTMLVYLLANQRQPRTRAIPLPPSNDPGVLRRALHLQRGNANGHTLWRHPAHRAVPQPTVPYATILYLRGKRYRERRRETFQWGGEGLLVLSVRGLMGGRGYSRAVEQRRFSLLSIGVNPTYLRRNGFRLLYR
ncbi:unnamed protein product, partial [Ectocarpus sp. 12 AP-2014]